MQPFGLLCHDGLVVVGLPLLGFHRGNIRLLREREIEKDDKDERDKGKRVLLLNGL